MALVDQEGVRSFIRRASRDYSTEMLLGVNARDRRHFDVVRFDFTTGASRAVFENPGYSSLVMDETLAVRLAVRVRPDGSVAVLEIAADGTTSLFLDVAPRPLSGRLCRACWRRVRGVND